MKMIVRAASAAFLLFAAATTALAVSTTPTVVSNTSWTDLGAGPLAVQTLGDTAQIAISDSAPTDRGFVLYSAVGNVPRDFQTTSHIWAKALNNSTTVVAAPISNTTGGSGGGGASGPVYGPTAEGTAPAQPPIYNGYKDAGGLTRGVSPTTPLPALSYDVRGTSLTLSSALNSFVDIPVNGQNVVGLRFAGLTASGATITYYSSNDTTQTPTSPISSFNASTGVLSPTRTTDGETRIPVSGRTTLRLQITTAGTGSITISYNVSARGTIVDLGSPIPPGNNVIGGVTQSGVPWAFNQTQVGGIALGNPTNYGTAPTGPVAGTNAFITNFPTTQNQGAAGSTPWPVTEGAANLGTTQATATTTSGQICAARAGRRAVTLTNLGTTDVWYGASGVTTGTGGLLLGTKGSAVTLNTAAAIFGVVATGSQAVACIETY